MKKATYIFTLLAVPFAFLKKNPRLTAVMSCICVVFPSLAQQSLGDAASGERNYILKTVYSVPLTAPPLLPTTVQMMRDVMYYDGLGRPMQEVGAKAAPNYSDVVVPIVYDSVGRQDRDYLPYATAAGEGGGFKVNAIVQQAGYYNSPPAGVVQIPIVGGTTPSFGQKVFEHSPLDRLLEQGFPGETWQPASTRTTGTGRTATTGYTTNNEEPFTLLAGTRKVALYRVLLSGEGMSSLVLDGHYGGGELYVTITRDENWETATGFTGRLYTVEEYKDKQDRVVLRRTFNQNGGTPEMQSTYYVYDDLGRLAYVLPPGTDPDRTGTAIPSAGELADYAYQYCYDGRGRLVSKKLPSKGWEYMVYNRQDLLVATQDEGQRALSPQEWTVSKYDAHGRVVLTGIWANTASLVLDTIRSRAYQQPAPNSWEELDGTAYTNRAWPTVGIHTVLMEQYYDTYGIAGFLSLPSAYHPTNYSTGTKGLPTVSRTRVLGTADYLWAVSYYDNKGRVVRQIRQHYLGGSYSENKFDDTETEYTFTGLPKKITRRHHTTSATIPSLMVVTEHGYDHRERLVDTWEAVDGQERTLVARNEYNEIGQLVKKSIGGDSGGANFHSDVAYAYNERGWLKSAVSPHFGYSLSYNVPTVGATAQYNGNISEQHWTRPGQPDRYFIYGYDEINRLMDGNSANGGMREQLAYDEMGNITSLTRDGGTTINYTYTGNRLTSLTGGLTGSYTYDPNGNATQDRTGMNFRYNYLNLPDSAWNATVHVGYLYDAMGTKLRKDSNHGGNRDYVAGIEYSGGDIELIHTAEGIAYRNANGTYTYRYNLTDHLGNVRSTIYRNPATNAVEVLQADDYYPFGKQYVVSGGNNKYLYNGKEKQEELGGQYDYGARFYDAEIGRFNVIDRFAEKYYDFAPYQYGANNPMRYIDINGDSISVAEIYREQFAQDLNNAFGDKANSLTFNSAGKLTLDGKAKDFVKGMSKEQKELFKGFNKVMNSKETVSVAYENNYELNVGGKVRSVDVVQEFGGGLYSKTDNTIVVAPNVGAVEVTLDVFPFPNQGVNQNTTSTLFHEIGEVNTTNLKFRGGVIKYENHVRKIIGLPIRPTDLNHSNTIPTQYKKP